MHTNRVNISAKNLLWNETVVFTGRTVKDEAGFPLFSSDKIQWLFQYVFSFLPQFY